MKTINHKLTFLLLLTSVLLSGCLPDSLTKFKKESAKPAAPYVDPGVVVTDSTGKTVDSSTITYPTSFYYRRNSNAITAFYAKVGQEYLNTYLNYIIDGTLGNETNKSLIFLRCELDIDLTDGTVLNDTLPPGLELDQSTCTFKGEPTSIYSDTAIATYGQPLNYQTRLYFKNAKNLSAGVHGSVTCTTTECYIKSTILKIAAYKNPNSLKMTQNDKLGLNVSAFASSISTFSVFDGDNATRSDITTSATGSMGAVQILNSDKSIVYIQRAIPLTVASTSGFTVGSIAATYDTLTVSSTAGLTVGDTLTTAGGYTGKLSSISGLVLRVVRSSTSGTTIGATLTNNGANITASALVTNPVYGIVLSKDTTNNILRVTQDPAYAGVFEVYSASVSGNSGILTPYGVNSVTTISSIDSDDGYRSKVAFDNDTQFYSSEAELKTTTQYYKVNKAIETIKPIFTNNNTVTPENGITYSISPALPTGLSFDTTTGYITGTFAAELEPTEFTITSTNALGSTTESIKLSAIYEPKDLSYTNMQVIPVSNAGTYPNAIFNEGDKIFQPLVAPATESAQGKILRKYSDTTTITVPVARTLSMLEIKFKNGPFNPANSIDSGNSYIAEKAYISSTDSVYHFNMVFYLTAASNVNNFSVGSYVTNSATAKARITYLDKTRKAIYVQFLTPDVNSVQIFKEGETITDSGSSGTGVIERLEAENYRLHLTNGGVLDLDATSFSPGNDVTASDGTSKIGGYIYSYDNASKYIYVDNVSRTPGVVNASNVVTTQYPQFENGQSIIAKERFATSAVSIDEVTHDNLIVAPRGEAFYLKPNISQGSTLNYSVTPALPTGLTLDANTGNIYGQPTYLTTRKTYIVTASNLLGSSKYKFDLEIRDYFKLFEVSDSTSYNLHKVGDTQNTRDCKVDANDIKNAQGLRDIRCYLDGQEEDIYTNKLKFKAAVGSGVCEYIQYAPFSFQRFKANPRSDAPTTKGSYTIPHINGCVQDTTPIATPTWIATDASACVMAPATQETCEDAGYTWVPVKNSCINTTKTASGPCGVAGGTWSPFYVTTQPNVASANYCPSNYSGWLGSAYPNCDEDTFKVKTIQSAVDSTGKCTMTYEEKLTNCGGNINSCIAGPIADVLTEQQIKLGYRSVVYTVSSGFSSPIIHRAPTEYGDYSNLRNANGILQNALTSSNDDIGIWASHIGTLSDIAIYGNGIDTTQQTRKMALQQNPFVNGVPVYTFNCLDAARDIKARIRLVVRDWDRAYKVTDGIDADDPLGSCSLTPYSTKAACIGGAGVWTANPNPKLNSDLLKDSFGVYYNQFEDWDNDYTSTLNSVANGAQADYTAGTCYDLASWATVPAATTMTACEATTGQLWFPTNDFAFPNDEL
jgi:hypothetical protein